MSIEGSRGSLLSSTPAAIRMSLVAFIAATVAAPYPASDAIIAGAAAITIAIAMSAGNQIRLRQYLPFLLAALAVASSLWSSLWTASLLGGMKLIVIAAVGWSVARALPLPGIVSSVANALTALLTLSLIVAVVRPDVGIVMTAYETGAIKGVFSHRNNLGFVAVLALVAGLAARRTRKRKFGTIVDLSVATACLVGAHSQSSFAALAAVIILWASVRLGRAVENATRGILLIGVATLVVAASSWIFVSASEITEGLGRDETLTGRTFIWEAVVNEARRNLVFGTGWDAAWHRGLATTYRMWSDAGFAMYHAHNGYLDFLLQIGVVGFALLLVLLIRALVRSIRLALAVDGPEAMWPAATVLILAVANLTESYFGSLLGWLLLVTCYCCTASSCRLRTYALAEGERMRRACSDS